MLPLLKTGSSVGQGCQILRSIKSLKIINTNNIRITFEKHAPLLGQDHPLINTCKRFLHHQHAGIIGVPLEKVQKHAPWLHRDVCMSRIFKRCLQHQHKQQRVGIIGVPFEKGQTKPGVGEGPFVLRRQGLEEELKKTCCEVIDFGDVYYNPADLKSSQVKNIKYLEHVAASQHEVSVKVKEVIESGCTVLTLGGDHSIGIGTIDGHMRAKKDVSIIWVDAHADINTIETSPTGNIHGMPVALLLKELVDFWPYLPGMDWQWPEISAQNLAYIGLRDVDDYERMIIEHLNITTFGMEEVQTLGVSEVVRQALEKIDPDKNRSLHLSFDIDALDPLEAPSTGTAVRGGLLLREGIQIVEECFRTNRLTAMDLVEFNPAIGTERDIRNTANAGIMLAKAVTGFTRTGKLHGLPNKIPLPNKNDVELKQEGM